MELMEHKCNECEHEFKEKKEEEKLLDIFRKMSFSREYKIKDFETVAKAHHINAIKQTGMSDKDLALAKTAIEFS